MKEAEREGWWWGEVNSRRGQVREIEQRFGSTGMNVYTRQPQQQ